MKLSGAACRRFTAILMMVALLITCLTPALAASVKAKINSSSARVYNVPSTSAKASVRAVKGIRVNVTGYANGWARISYNGHTGYMQSKYLNLVNRVKAYTSKSTPVYKQASSSSTRLGTLSTASTVYVVGRSGSYFRVQNQSGSVTGYIAGSNLSSKKPSTSGSSNSGSAGDSGTKAPSYSSSMTTSEKLDYVIYVAKQLIGRPYKLSDNPPNSFNCSSFVQYCMGKARFSMYGTAATQAADGRYTKITDISALKKGDILCFDTDTTNGENTCDHTAIYLGNNQFIHASSAKGYVTITSMTSYYRNAFLWARRVG